MKQSSPISAVIVRGLTVGDLREVARVHCQAFPQAALTLLGPQAVYRYYHWQLTGPHQCVGLGAWAGGRLCGYAFGGRFHGALRGFLQKNRAYLVLSLATRPWLLARHAFRDRISLAFRSLARGLRQRSASISQEGLKRPSPARVDFGILAIGVDPDMRRLGVGRLLMERSESAARTWSASQMGLSVAVDNSKAIAFYEALGWRRENRTGDWTGRMVKELAADS